MKKINIIFGTYNSLARGLTDAEFEAAYQKNYKPFLSRLNLFPNLNLTLYYSGVLLEWLDNHHPEFIMLLSDMVKRKQVELLTGGYFEPILPLIPLADRIGQIEKMTTFLRTSFGRRPRGCWLAQGVWESNLASTLVTSGIEFTFLCDRHFQRSGIEKEQLFYSYLTEDQGKILTIFPTQDQMISLFAKDKPEKLLEHITRQSDAEAEKIICLMFDGNSLDDSSEVHNWKWMNDFITQLDNAKEILSTVFPSRYTRIQVPRSKIYFASSSAVDPWAMPSSMTAKMESIKRKLKHPDDIVKYLNEGFFRQFLAKYTESNHMYSKMMYANILVNQIKGDKYRKKAAREELWGGQNQYAYWHGDGHGIYQGNLRQSIYKSLIEAEKVTRQNGMFIPSIISFDFDMDGVDEHLYQDTDLNAYVHVKGGIVFELDFLPTAWNYGDSLCRRPEVYHLENEHYYDKYLRKLFVDHFFSPRESLQNFKTGSYEEQGNFMSNRYKLDNIDKEHFELLLSLNGKIIQNKMEFPVLLEKRYRFSNTIIDVFYTIKNLSPQRLDLTFGSELNLSFCSWEREKFFMYTFAKNEKKELPDKPNTQKEVDKVAIQDLYNNVLININSTNTFTLWSLAVETVSYAQNSRAKLYQSSCFVLRWSLTLEPEQSWQTRIALSFSRM